MKRWHAAGRSPSRSGDTRCDDRERQSTGECRRDSGGAGTALVGDPHTVAARIKEYQDIGIDTFILSGYPHLEEAYRFAELVFPLLKLSQAGNVTPIRVNTGPFGETIANEQRPLFWPPSAGRR